MSSNAYADREAIFAALAKAEDAHREIASRSLDALSSDEVLAVLTRRESLAWRAPSIDHRLLNLAAGFGPAHFQRLATVLLMVLGPDGRFADRDRAAKRSLTVSAQHRDGMRKLRATLTPEAWATLEPILEKLAAPGMCNPDDEHPCVSGTPSEEQIRADHRSASQRNHDALVAAMRALLASGDLGQHNGLPVTVANVEVSRYWLPGLSPQVGRISSARRPRTAVPRPVRDGAVWHGDRDGTERTFSY